MSAAVTNWDVPCPTCGAEANMACTKNGATHFGQRTLKFHAARVRAAKQARNG